MPVTSRSSAGTASTYSAERSGTDSTSENPACQAQLSVNACGSAAAKCSCRGSCHRFLVDDVSIARLSVEQSYVSLRMTRSQVSNLYIRASQVVIHSSDEFEDFSLEKGTIKGCLLRLDGEYQVPASLLFKDCFIRVIRDTDVTSGQRSSLGFQHVEAGSWVLDTGTEISVKQLKEAKCGLLGFEYADSITKLREFEGSGILIAARGPVSTELPKDKEYLAIPDKLVICSRPWFMREIAGNEHGMISDRMRGASVAQIDYEAATRSVIEDLKQMIRKLSRE